MYKSVNLAVMYGMDATRWKLTHMEELPEVLKGNMAGMAIWYCMEVMRRVKKRHWKGATREELAEALKISARTLDRTMKLLKELQLVEEAGRKPSTRRSSPRKAAIPSPTLPARRA